MHIEYLANMQPFQFVIHLVYLFIIGGLFVYLTNKHKKALTDYKEQIDEAYKEQTAELVEQNKILQKKNKKNEELVANILPQQTANELRSHGKAVSRRYEMVTVLFADIKGFTKIAEMMNPEILIDELDKIFFFFDSVAEKYNIEKIKTIGDAYMCAGGIPVKNKTNPVEVVLAALEMQDYLVQLHKDTSNHYAKIWNIRIGIHTGPVVAGVVGKKKFSYDIWGDSVNVASRMESSGDIGKINVSSTTYNYTQDFFDFEYRGRMPVKYKGEIEMYFVKGIKNELSNFGDHSILNKIFKAKIALLRIDDLKEIIGEKFAKEMNENLRFHNIQFVSDFCNKVELFGLGEHIHEEELLLLETSALLYCVGLLNGHENFRERSIDYAKEILPGFMYSANQIENICQIIESGKKILQPKNKLDEIFSDAYFDFYGSFDLLEKLESYYSELLESQQVGGRKEWFKKQLAVISKHKFWTPTARMLRDVSREEQIIKLNYKIKNMS